MFHFKLFHVPRLLSKKYIISVWEAVGAITQIPQKGIINIIVVSENDMEELNQSYRKKEGPTDILTFSYLNSVERATDIAGEIYLCLEKIRLYALEREVSYESQLRYIIIHGLVHMMGYDHETDNESREMEKIEQKVQVLLEELK